jgi:hypothetical protein
MMSRFPTSWTRIATGAAVLALVALTGVATPALAADPQPDLFVSFDRDPVAEIDNSGATVGMYVYNYGEAPATGVTVTLDASAVSDAVAVSVPDWSDECKLSGTKVACTVGRLEAGQVITVHAMDLASRKGAKPGAAGSVTVTIAGVEDDANPGDNTTSFPVTVIASGPDLVAMAEDLSTRNNPVGPGDTAPLHAAVLNEGDTPATDFSFTFSLHTGAVVVERYNDCTYTDYWPDAVSGTEYAYGPSEVSCVVPLTLKPGEALVLFDEAGGESAFTARFGRNLAGPLRHTGLFSVAVAGELAAAKGVRAVKGNGPSFAAKAKKLQAAAAKRGGARKGIAAQELDELDNYADFSFWSKKNTLDVSVTAAPVEGAVGKTVEVVYEVVNHGPSDGGGPGVDIIAPSGTVLLPTEWCWTAGTDNEQRPESKQLRCNFESIFPSVHSGYGRLKPTVRVKIKSTPGTNGTITARSGGVGSIESKPANNTAAIVITTTGGSGGGLANTGTSTGVVAGAGAAVAALGITLFMMARRRRVILVVPND